MSLTGYAYILKNAKDGREFLAMHTFGTSKTRAQSSLNTMNFRRMKDRKEPLEAVRLCAVCVVITSGQPPVLNAFVEDGCELFALSDKAPD